MLALSSESLSGHTAETVPGKQEAAHLAPAAKVGQGPGIADRFPQNSPEEAVAWEGISVACSLSF